MQTMWQCSCLTAYMQSAVLQYVFVLLRGEDFYVGGHLWRSDSFGQVDSWQDVTPKLSGQALYDLNVI